MAIDEETLMAFADGELSGPEAEAVAAAIATDPALAEKVAQHRQLRSMMSSAFDPVLTAPVPAALLAAASAKEERVISLEDARKARKERASNVVPFVARWGSIAAALAIGLIGGQMLDFSGNKALVGTSGGVLVARAGLADALDTQLAANGVSGTSIVRIGLSFRNHQGEFCRTFSPVAANAPAGLACRDGDQWQLRFTATHPGSANQPDYRMAGENPAIMEAAQAMMAGEPLNAAEELKARDAEWNNRR